MASDMANDQKKISKGNDSVDRLSSLPDNLIESIMDFMSPRDAARTCMLSTRWRYIWARHPSLVLDSEFWDDIKKSKKECSKTVEECSDIVGKILQHRVGYIRTFVLQDAASYMTTEIESWLFSLCSGGLKELRVATSGYRPYRVPCSVYSSSDLIKLHLSGCIIKSGCFTNIRTLSLVDIYFDSDVELTTPLLTNLRIESCKDDILCFDISAPRLKSLSLRENDELILEPFLKCTGISRLNICNLSEYAHFRKGRRDRLKSLTLCCESFCLVKLVAAWPRLSELETDGRCLEYLTAGSIPSKLGQLSLRSLKIDCSDVNSFQMPWILCILKNSPLLQTFDINFDNYFDWMPNIDESKFSLDQLHTVILRNFLPGRLLFAKVLLQCAPVLKTMLVEELEEKEYLGDELDVEILKELLPLQHEFPKTRIVFGPCP